MDDVNERRGALGIVVLALGIVVRAWFDVVEGCGRRVYRGARPSLSLIHSTTASL